MSYIETALSHCQLSAIYIDQHNGATTCKNNHKQMKHVAEYECKLLQFPSSIIPKCNLLISIHRSLPGQVNSCSPSQSIRLGHSTLKSETGQNTGRISPVGNLHTYKSTREIVVSKLDRRLQ